MDDDRKELYPKRKSCFLLSPAWPSASAAHGNFVAGVTQETGAVLRGSVGISMLIPDSPCKHKLYLVLVWVLMGPSVLGPGMCSLSPFCVWPI